MNQIATIELWTAIIGLVAAIVGLVAALLGIRHRPSAPSDSDELPHRARRSTTRAKLQHYQNYTTFNINGIVGAPPVDMTAEHEEYPDSVEEQT